MLKADNHIALVLFVRTPAEEARNKKLLPRLKQAFQKKVFQGFNAQARRVLAGTKLPFFVFTSDQQRGETFGDRMNHCLAETFALGFDKILVVGNDCPALGSKNLLQAVENLRHQDAVIGPDQRGGIYLLGLTRNLFNRIPGLVDLAWQTSNLARDLQLLIASAGGQAGQLPELADVNNLRDLVQNLRAKAFAASLLNWLSELILEKLPRLTSWNYFLPLAVALRQPLFRGPPPL